MIWGHGQIIRKSNAQVSLFLSLVFASFFLWFVCPTLLCARWLFSWLGSWIPWHLLQSLCEEPARGLTLAPTTFGPLSSTCPFGLAQFLPSEQVEARWHMCQWHCWLHWLRNGNCGSGSGEGSFQHTEAGWRGRSTPSKLSRGAQIWRHVVHPSPKGTICCWSMLMVPEFFPSFSLHMLIFIEKTYLKRNKFTNQDKNMNAVLGSWFHEIFWRTHVSFFLSFFIYFYIAICPPYTLFHLHPPPLPTVTTLLSMTMHPFPLPPRQCGQATASPHPRLTMNP